MCVPVKKAFAVCPWEKGFQNYDICRAPPFAQDFSVLSFLCEGEPPPISIPWGTRR